jgi:hypothetical protein
MRFACCGSSLSSSRAAASDSSTLYAVTLHNGLERDRGFFSRANTVERAFAKVEILDIFEMFEDGFANVETLCVASAARHLLENDVYFTVPSLASGAGGFGGFDFDEFAGADIVDEAVDGN